MNTEGKHTSEGGADDTPSFSSESPFIRSDGLRGEASAEDGEEHYELAEYGYGKNYIKLLKVARNGEHHTIREYEVNTHLQLDSREDFLQGVNKHIIATDTQKNTVYVLAKKFGVRTITVAVNTWVKKYRC